MMGCGDLVGLYCNSCSVWHGQMGDTPAMQHGLPIMARLTVPGCMHVSKGLACLLAYCSLDPHHGCMFDDRHDVMPVATGPLRLGAVLLPCADVVSRWSCVEGTWNRRRHGTGGEVWEGGIEGFFGM